jgi:DNA polymerase
MPKTSLDEPFASSSKDYDLKLIEEDILNNFVCPLKDSAKNLVFGKGNSDADILFIGEAPGAREDELGQPFVGSAGCELDKLLSGIGLSLSDVYIANILKYRPPSNRNPSSEEIRRHTPFLIRQISVIKPKIICTLGNYATKFALAGFKSDNMNKIKGISIVHGRPHKINDLIVFPLYHPAAMLYNPRLRSVLVDDFVKLKKLLY